MVLGDQLIQAAGSQGHHVRVFQDFAAGDADPFLDFYQVIPGDDALAVFVFPPGAQIGNQSEGQRPIVVSCGHDDFPRKVGWVRNLIRGLLHRDDHILISVLQ